MMSLEEYAADVDKYIFVVMQDKAVYVELFITEQCQTMPKDKIPYDEIVYGKVWPGHKRFYVDDRTIRPSEFLKYTPDELDTICADLRCENT